MSNLMWLKDNITKYSYIKELKDLSDSLIKRLRIIFKNGYELSIVHSKYVYCDENSFEVALIYNNKLIETIDGAGVVGYVKFEQIVNYIEQIGKL